MKWPVVAKDGLLKKVEWCDTVGGDNDPGEAVIHPK